MCRSSPANRNINGIRKTPCYPCQRLIPVSLFSHFTFTAPWPGWESLFRKGSAHQACSRSSEEMSMFDVKAKNLFLQPSVPYTWTPLIFLAVFTLRAQRHSFTLMLTPWPNSTAGLSFFISQWTQISQNLLQSQDRCLRNTGPCLAVWHLPAMQQSTDSFLTKPSRGLVLQRFCSISQANTPRKLGLNPSWEGSTCCCPGLFQPTTNTSGGSSCRTGVPQGGETSANLATCPRPKGRRWEPFCHSNQQHYPGLSMGHPA